MTTTADLPGYWLFEWLDSHRISSDRDLRTALGTSATLSELRDVAEEWWTSPPKTPSKGTNLLASSGLRLDDRLSCPRLDCRRNQVDVLFRHAWHYFDSILLPDGVGQLLLHRDESLPGETFLTQLFDLIAVAKYIRDIGASELVHYYARTWPPVTENVSGLVSDKNEDDFFQAYWDVVAKLGEQGEYFLEERGAETVRVSVRDPNLGYNHFISVEVPKPKERIEDLILECARQVALVHLWELGVDLQAHQQLGGSALGSTVWSHKRFMSSNAPTSAGDVAMRLTLPILIDIPVKELITVRDAEAESFQVFRTALTRAAQEMIRKGPVTNPQEIADSIVREIINPELAKLTHRLNLAQQALTRKTTISIAMSGLAITCGVLLGAPSSVAGLAGAGIFASGLGAAVSKHVDEKQEIQLSDMYFLWKALAHKE
jgi:hypothetical protein